MTGWKAKLKQKMNWSNVQWGYEVSVSCFIYFDFGIEYPTVFTMLAVMVVRMRHVLCGVRNGYHH